MPSRFWPSAATAFLPRIGDLRKVKRALSVLFLPGLLVGLPGAGGAKGEQKTMPRCESQPQETGARARTEEPPALLPLDLPLPAQPPLAARWLRQAIVLQPWGE